MRYEPARLALGGLTLYALGCVNGQNVCMNPEASKPDPNYRTVKIPDAKRLKAVPAFVVDTKTQSGNEDLVR